MNTSVSVITWLYHSKGSSSASIQDTNSLHSKKGKGMITPIPDTSGLGFT